MRRSQLGGVDVERSEEELGGGTKEARKRVEKPRGTTRRRMSLSDQEKQPGLQEKGTQSAKPALKCFGDPPHQRGKSLVAGPNGQTPRPC